MNLNWSYTPETPDLGQNWWIFVLCDREIWQMTWRNNKAPLLCYCKLCASFRSKINPMILCKIQVHYSTASIISFQQHDLYKLTPCLTPSVLVLLMISRSTYCAMHYETQHLLHQHAKWDIQLVRKKLILLTVIFMLGNVRSIILIEYSILARFPLLSNLYISHNWVGNKIVDHSDVVGASLVSTTPNTSSFFT